MLRRRASLAGRRLALDRKFELNYLAYGGAVGLAQITPPGADVLPFDTDVCTHPVGEKCSGEKGCKVEWIYALVYEGTVQARMSRLWEAAARSADRVVRRMMWQGQLPVQVSNVRSPQQRGVSHFHYGLPLATEIERAWSRHVRRFLQQQAKREASMDPADVWAALEREYMTGEITRGIYGFGFVNFGKMSREMARAQSAGNSASEAAIRTQKAARYSARNAAGYQAGQATRHYVATRLTKKSGVTMRALRSLNYLYVRRMLVATGELEDSVIPGYWKPEWIADVLRVEALVRAAAGP
jgi:hypothetical protein